MENKLSKRKNLRINKYNYSDIGYYFITICIKNKKCILSTIANDEKKQSIKIKLLPYGLITEKYIKSTNNIYDNIIISNYVIMPNHIHFICEIINKDEVNRLPANATIPCIVGTLKKLINKECKEKIWQRNYYEHIIRNENEYLKILEYIQNNPYKWGNDKYYI